jgi:hypothetical protein
MFQLAASTSFHSKIRSVFVNNGFINNSFGIMSTVCATFFQLKNFSTDRAEV